MQLKVNKKSFLKPWNQPWFKLQKNIKSSIEWELEAFKGLTQYLTKLHTNFKNRQNASNKSNKQTIKNCQDIRAKNQHGFMYLNDPILA